MPFLPNFMVAHYPLTHGLCNAIVAKML